MQFSVLARVLMAFVILGVSSSPAAAHLVAGRRPLDYFVRNADAVLTATAQSVTSGRQGGYRTTFLPEQCLSGDCPDSAFTTQPRDDHVAEFMPGTRALLAIRRSEGTEASDWVLLQNSWEAKLGPRYLAKAIEYVPRYAALSSIPERQREKAYVNLLLEQVADAEPLIQDDALQSLLRLPAKHAGAEAVSKLLKLTQGAAREAQQTALVAIAQSWNEAATREFIRSHAELASAWPAAKARMLAVLADGDETDRGRTCSFLDDADARVRAIAATGCLLPSAKLWPTLYEKMTSEKSSLVQKALQKRFKESADGITWLVSRIRSQLPFWKRWYYSATGKEPSEVKKMLTE